MHHHTLAQLIYAAEGVIVVCSDMGQWVVPSSRGIWMPALTDHTVRMVSAATMWSLYIQPDALLDLPQHCRTVAISDLLRQLISSATTVSGDYKADSRDGRLMRLILDEFVFLPVLPLHLPRPSHPYLRPICQQISDIPDDNKTLIEWAAIIGVNAKTLQRLFAQETGMTFGRWRQQARLLIALERLAMGERILDVALNLGYDSPSAFAAMFKKHLGVAPSEYFRASDTPSFTSPPTNPT